jgi:hypothetical protein
MQCQFPLAFERLACRNQPDAMHIETGAFERPEEDVMGVVGYLSYDDAVDNRRVDARGRRSRGSANAEQTSPPLSAPEACRKRRRSRDDMRPPVNSLLRADDLNRTLLSCF